MSKTQKSDCCNSELVSFNKDYNQCFVCEKIQKKQNECHKHLRGDIIFKDDTFYSECKKCGKLY